MNWRVFVPGLAMLGIGWGPLFVVPILLRPFHVDLMGFSMARGFVVALPATIAGVVTLIGGVFALIIRAARN
jgi:hypothetical protein